MMVRIRCHRDRAWVPAGRDHLLHAAVLLDQCTEHLAIYCAQNAVEIREIITYVLG